MSRNKPWRPTANPWIVAVVVTLAVFMEILDSTIVNVALPHIAGSLSSSYDESTWVLTSYLVANGIALPISGFFSRMLGRKRYFILCITMWDIHGTVATYSLPHSPRLFRRWTATRAAIRAAGLLRA